MEISFSELEIRDLCESQEKAEEVFPAHVASALRDCLADLRSAAHLVELEAIWPNVVLQEDGFGTIDLGDGYKISIGQGHIDCPNSPSGNGVDWLSVSRCQILMVGPNDDWKH